MDADDQGTPLQPRQKRTAGFVRQLALAIELPFIPVVAVVIAGGLGYYLDGRIHTSPLFTIVLGLLGFLAGVREILRRLSKEAKKNGE